MATPFDYELTELHTHVGGAVSPEIMWSLAHSQGIKIRGKDYWAFVDSITVRPGEIKGINDYLDLFNVTELIQSSPEGMEESCRSIVGGAYRKNLITRMELRFNPMLRNRGGERDLDHIISAAIRGTERAMLEYPVSAGLLLMLDRRFPLGQNAIIVDKAIKYKNRGVVGIDLGGPDSPGFKVKDYAELYAKAGRAGLGTTIHAGETDANAHEVATAVEELGVSRMGHGVKAAWDEKALKLLRDRGVTLELCPTSNLNTNVVRGVGELKFVVDKLLEAEVKFTINADGPEMLCTSLRKERDLLKREGIMDDEQLLQTEDWARQACFVK